MVRRKLGKLPSLFGSIFFVAIQTAIFLTLTESLSSPLAPESSRSPKDVSADIVRNLRRSSSTTGKLLDLETDFYDTTTGLHSEGVWHNALVGIALLESSRSNNNRDDFDHADRIASALFRYSWDGNTSFCRRRWSGRWDHSSLDSDINPPEQANYYRESSEHRCVQHGMALAFWSKLVLLSESNDNNYNLSTLSDITEEQRLIAGCFAREFWDPSVRKWTTISQSQGGGDVSRPSASADKRTLGLSDEEKTTPYYRAVDQAVAVLAALEHLKVLNRGNNDDANEEEQNVWIDLVRTTCSQILAPVEDGGFGYGNVGRAKSYLGLDRNRNFWHDGWTFLALLKAREHISWPSSSVDSNGNIDHGESELLTMWYDLLEMYECKSGIASSGVVWHWPRELKDENSNVRYCGDNVLAHAIRRNLHHVGEEKQEEGFWNFVASIREGNDGGLASVADVYPQVRLHPNTELSALLVWP